MAARLVPLGPGALLVALGFSSGGYFPGPSGRVAVVLAVGLLLHVTLTSRPFSGLSRGYLAGAAILALLAVWSLVSSSWSDAPSRALVEYARVLLYVLAFVVFGAAGRSEGHARWMTRGLAGGIVVVCVAGLVSRVAPDVLEAAESATADRLSHPLTYWNALGLLAVLGILLALALSADARERRGVQVLAAAVVPALAATLLLTFSRGALVAGVLGLAVLLVAGRSRAIAGTLLATIPPTAVAVASALGADLLGSDTPTSAAAAEQGHDVALVVGLCTVGAAVLRAALLGLDRRLEGVHVPRRPAVVALGVAGIAAVAVATAAGAWGELGDQADRFVDGGDIEDATGRARLLNPGNNGRIDHWDVALQSLRDEPLHGEGAGTYSLAWERERPEVFQAEDAHSLYLEMLGELGVVGLLLVASFVALALGGLAARARGPGRGPWAGLLAAAVAWAAHAGIDWDWEMPAVTLWVMAAAGLALAAPVAGAARGSDGARGTPRTLRVVIGLGCLVLAVVPARLSLSDSALRDSARAFARGDCETAIDRGLDAVSHMDSRPEPHAIVGYCDARLRQPRLAVLALERAVSRDPRNWEFHYGLGVVRAAAGRDPRGAFGRAARLNPGESLIFRAQERFASSDPEVWKRRALTTRLPTD